MPEHIPVLVVTGPVGVGKTTVATEISALLADAGIPHACGDMDGLRDAWPAPPDDRFNTALGLRNLAAIWRNFQAAGAQRLILADVVERLARYETIRTRMEQNAGSDKLRRLHAPRFASYATLLRGIEYERGYVSWCRWLIETIEAEHSSTMSAKRVRYRSGTDLPRIVRWLSAHTTIVPSHSWEGTNMERDVKSGYERTSERTSASSGLAFGGVAGDG